MGKNHIENSLKRFLKRKVKITLGLVVAFMITGTVGFAADSTTVGEHNQNFEGISNAKDNLTGINNPNKKFEDMSEKEITIGGNKYFVKMEDNILSFEKEDESAPTINSVVIEGEHISDKLKETIDNILANIENPNTSDADINNSILTTVQKGNKTNNGIIIASNNTTALQIVESNQTIKNNGILIGKGYYNQYSAKGSSNATIINNGLIYTSEGYGQDAFDAAENITLINNGIIDGVSITNGILNESNGQTLTGINSKAINNGIITVKRIGQNINKDDENDRDAISLNYGIINAGTGQKAEGIKNTVYNYGVLSVTDIGISTIDEAKGYNYGVVKISNASKAFSGDVTNKGIVIADNGTLGAYNTGILLDSNYEVRGEDTKVFGTDETVESLGNNDSFGENITKGFVKDTTVKIDNTEGKVIGAVVTDSSLLDTKVTVKDKDGADKKVGTVLDYTGENENGLLLKDTTVTGYFEDDGVLLNVGNKNLTLAGDTNITAVRDDIELDVYAVNIEKGGAITVLGDKAQINGLINGEDDTTITFTSSKGQHSVNGDKVVVNIDDGGKGYENYFIETLDGGTNGGKVNEIVICTEKAVKDLTNRLTIEDNLIVGTNNTYGTNVIYDINDGSDADHNNTDAMFELDIKNIDNIKGNISLGVGQDTVKVYNKYILEEEKPVEPKRKIEINLGEGEDKFVAVGDRTVVNKKEAVNIFNYNVVNAETVELDGGTWGAWDKATGSVKTDAKQPNLKLGNDTTMNITLGTENQGSDFANYVDKNLDMEHAYITGAGNGSAVKYLINEKTGLDMTKLTSDKYSFNKEKVEFKSAIFDVDTEKESGTTVTLRTADDMGLSGEQRIIYNAYMGQIKSDVANENVIKEVNGYDSKEEFIGRINKIKATGKAYYTAGSVVTKDITNSYISSVEDFTKRAGKGEWLAQGKYINSDTEFDGGAEVKGYDGDITATVGMIEYGVSENTSYGAVFGMGDSKMDINGGGKLDGDNAYIGVYMKHRTQKDIELVGNIGYMKNDMDSVLRNDFKVNNTNLGENKTFEKGTADSSAVVMSVKGRKNYRISDSVKLQPTLGARLTLINQEEAESPEMNFTIKEQDIIVLEGTAGMGIAKEFTLSKEQLELKAGVEYTFAATSSTNDAEYTMFQQDDVPLEDVDTAENTGTIYFGADYEHENGVGFNGKYEMMWSDKGDDSRITAGVSYRF